MDLGLLSGVAGDLASRHAACDQLAQAGRHRLGEAGRGGRALGLPISWRGIGSALRGGAAAEAIERTDRRRRLAFGALVEQAEYHCLLPLELQTLGEAREGARCALRRLPAFVARLVEHGNQRA